MHKASIVLRKGLLYLTALVLVAGYPTVAMADTEVPVTETAPVSTATTETSGTGEQQEPLTYTYDPETKKWNSEEWQFNPESGAYEKPPAPIIIEPVVQDPTQSTAEKTVDTTVGVDNTIISDALSGDALVSNNTLAGSALSGDASATATIINAINSSIAASENQKVATFTQDITGDVTGDIVLYPLLLKAMLEAEIEKNATTIQSSTDLDVNNEITLTAKSGDATVEGNTLAGDATTGNAAAMANVVNILNSLIAAQDSFIGTINIYGSLEGDILIAPDFIPQMLASNGSGGSSGTQLSAQDTTTIVNNISAVAQSGAADVFNNTTGGSATTGTADSSVVIFNVTGHDIVAENSMLVFVNVLGKWVGMIVDAPAGATAAMIGSGVESQKIAPNLVVDSVTRHGITNTIAVNAETGDAVVANNTIGGNATSGNASAQANVANVSNSSLSLTGWFGVLFINITGDWYGSFQVNTPFGNPPAVSTPTKPTPTAPGPVQFIPKQPQPAQAVARTTDYTIIDSRTVADNGPAVLATSTQPEAASSAPEVQGVMSDDETATRQAPQVEPQDFRLWMAAGAVVLVGASIIGFRRFL